MQAPAPGRRGLILSTILLAPALAAQAIPADTEIKTHPSGLRYSILTPGKGPVGKPGDLVAFSFDEWLSDGTHIDGSKKRGQERMQIQIGDKRAPLGLTMAGALVGAGGTVKITANPNQAYGPQGVPGRIPPNSTMVYVVTVHELKQAIRFAPGDPQATKTTKSGLKYEILKAGQGDPVGADQIVRFGFTVWSMQGEYRMGDKFPSEGQPAPIHMLSHPFMQELLPQMRAGEVRRVVATPQHTVQQISEETVWRLHLIDAQPEPKMPESKEERGKSTKSGLFLEMLERGPGRGDPPKQGEICSVEFSFWWKEDGKFVAGQPIAPPMEVAIGAQDGQPHKFLAEVLGRMQVGDRYRVEVPAPMSSPRLLPKDSVWVLKLLKIRKPDPVPQFPDISKLELKKTNSGLQYAKVGGKGSGRKPTVQDTVEVHYSGWLTDGKGFDSSYQRGQTISFPLGRVIRGWQEGLALMRPGEEFVLVIPGALGYPQGTPDGRIPANATLVFFVKLVAIK